MPDPELIKDFIYEYLSDYLSSLEFGPDESLDDFEHSNYLFKGKSMVEEPLIFDNILISPQFIWYPKTNKVNVKFKITIPEMSNISINDLEKLGFKMRDVAELELNTNIEGEDVGLSSEFIDENYIYEYIRFQEIDEMFDALEYDGIMDNIAEKIIELGKKGLVDISRFE